MRQGQNKYCLDCRDVARKEVNAKRYLRIIGKTELTMITTCRDCGVEFTKTGLKQFFCGACGQTRQAARHIRWRKLHPEKTKAIRKALDTKRLHDPDRRAKMREYAKAHARKRSDDPHFVLNRRMSQLVRHGLISGKGGKSWKTLLGYDVEQLAKHIERQFVRGMNWKNIHRWHIDHIRPIASFKFSSPDDPEFKACWAITNLRPLWAIENIKKSDNRIFLI